MVVAIVGSRSLFVEDLGRFIPHGVTRIVSGGAKGIDTCAKEYALKMGIEIVEYIPDYQRYRKAAPLIRNRAIVDCADEVLIFWDGKSRGTKYVIDYCDRIGKKNDVYII